MVQVHCHEETLTLPQEQPRIHFHTSSPCSGNYQDLCAVTEQEAKRFCTNLMLKCEPWYPLGYLIHSLLLSQEATLCPVLAHWTTGITKSWSLQMGTASHANTAKPESREHNSISPRPLSLCTCVKVLFIREEKLLAWSKIWISRLSKYERQYWEPVLNHLMNIWSANTHVV